jgi:hypothetical protein
MTASHPIHVIPHARGSWHVRREGEPVALSEHANETEAERAAVRQANLTGAREVIVHDRYGRVHRTTSRLRY